MDIQRFLGKKRSGEIQGFFIDQEFTTNTRAILEELAKKLGDPDNIEDDLEYNELDVLCAEFQGRVKATATTLKEKYKTEVPLHQQEEVLLWIKLATDLRKVPRPINHSFFEKDNIRILIPIENLLVLQETGRKEFIVYSKDDEVCFAYNLNNLYLESYQQAWNISENNGRGTIQIDRKDHSQPWEVVQCNGLKNSADTGIFIHKENPFIKYINELARKNQEV